jgi:predicted O-methyltransferase YrrM
MSDKTIHLDERLYEYFRGTAYREHEVLRALRERTRDMTDGQMQITPEQGALMAMIVRLSGARHILEVGIFTGYSTLAMALALPAGGKIVASDVSEEWTAIARQYWTKAGMADRITLRLKPGRKVIAELKAAGESFDLMFIDADKSNYDHYYEDGLAIMKSGGLVMIDNVLWDGAVADPSKKDADTLAIRALNKKIHGDQRVDLSMVPIGDGLTLARKR